MWLPPKVIPNTLPAIWTSAYLPDKQDKMKLVVKPLFLLIALLFTNSSTHAQTVIEGQVTDLLGKKLPNVGLFVVQAQDSSLVSLGISGQDGHFKIASITPGLYRLRYTLDGYQTVYSDPIRISQGRRMVKMGKQKLKKTQPLTKPPATRRARA